MKTIILLCFALNPFSHAEEITNLTLECKTECRFYYEKDCSDKTAKIILSTDKKNPSNLYTDIDITCSVSGTPTQIQKSNIRFQ
ncbi:MAG: hypothetical protein A2451_06525 [Bdellovibrionales bacterium RIFOXYC2_FULL_39_8]|nr:MAG: hypothetical protein A2451_06525 [Bdellovibrionales bacterium RIFOXYC2_FULL_39_8]